MAASPYNFATCDTNAIKLYGGNIIQIPADQGCPPGTVQGGPQYTAYEFYRRWATVLPNWIVPQLKAWKGLGANCVRCMGGQDGVFMGYYTQAVYEQCIRDLIAAYRTQGLWLGQPQMGVLRYGNVVKPDGTTPALADYKAALASVYANCYAGNEDAIAWIEAGNQETRQEAAENAVTAALATYAKTLGTVPVLISTIGSNPAHIYDSAGADVISVHLYPDFEGFPTDLQSLVNLCANTVNNIGGTIPTFVEECGGPRGPINGSAPGWQAKADLIDGLAAAYYPHPECAGLVMWGGYGPSVDGDWSLFQPATGSSFDPAQVRGGTVASAKFASYSPANRNLSFAVTADANQAIPSAAPGAITMSTTTGSTANPSVPAFTFGVRIRRQVTIKAAGTASVSSATPVTLRLIADDTFGGVQTVLASATIPANASSQAFALSALFPASPHGVNIRLTAQAASGTGTLTALAATLSAGNAPVIAAPVGPGPRAGKAVLLPNGKLLLRADGKLALMT